jgi:hypothetical protein
MNEDEEIIDINVLVTAMNSLNSVQTIAAVQKLAREIVNAEISICYCKLDGYEHKFSFVIYPATEVSIEATCTLMSKLARLFSYDDIVVLLPKVGIENQYASFTQISPDNAEEVHNFIADFMGYLERKGVIKSPSPVFDNFIRLLKEADEDQKENLLWRLAHECDGMDIQLDIEFKKRPRIGNQ